MSYKFHLTVILLLFSFLSQIAHASDTETITQFLRAFHANPKEVMHRLPSMVDKQGNAHPRGMIRSAEADWKLRLAFRDKIRRKLLSTSSLSSALQSLERSIREDSTIGGDSLDYASLLVEPGPLLTNISDMQSESLASASAPVTPWSDSYWPLYKGMGANRYTDSNFPESDDWQTNFDYSQANSATSIFSSQDADQIDSLSPSEKYDYVMGDTNFTLSQFDWNQGQSYNDEYGSVPSWMGICHGWSGAAHMGALYTKNPVTVQAPNGTAVRFYPQDVKALQSMLWAFAPPPARVAGSRCEVENPATDDNGRIIDPSCFDVSPSTWHESIVNQLGVHRRSFVMDATYDIEVWNFPIAAYSYSYFNPQTFQYSTDIHSAIIPMSEFSNDKFHDYRSPDAVNIVGVYMDVSYVTEMSPNHGPSNEEPEQTVRYVYDLELDANNNIIGTGEWYQLAHPDFLWTFTLNSQAETPEDQTLANDQWNSGEGPVPSSWMNAARGASGRGAPLYSFIRQLVQKP